MNKVLTRGIITIAAVNDGKDGHSLTAKAFIEGSYRNGFTKGVKSYVKVFYDGQEVKDFTVSYRYKGAGQADWVKPQTNKEDSWSDAQRDGSTLFVEYVVEYKGLKALATGRLDNIQDGRDGLDAVVFRLIPKIEKAVVHGTKRETAKVVLFLKYMITRKEGEKHYSELGRLDSFGLSLTIEPSWASFEVKLEDGKPYWVIKTTYKYANCFDNTPFFRVCLMQGGKVLDARTIGLQYEAEVNFDFGKRINGIDGKIDGISGTVNSLDGKVSGFETTIDHFRTEVKDKVSHSELKQTADSFSLTVANGTRPNLLWGSDLNLDDVDTTSKEAIEKRLGVVISGDMEIGNREMFQYLKGEGVGGSDAIHFKNAYKREDWAKWTNISWKDVPLKPNTRYTISVWVKFKSYGRKGCMYVDCASDDGRYCFGGYLYKEHYYDRADIDEWQRVRYVFDSGASKRLSSLFFSCIADEKEGAQCEIWLCHPKLEEGEVATPWCAYDGTVDALLAGGFDIKEKKYTATSDNFVVQNNKGEQTFFVDENGALRSIDTSGKGCIVLRPHAGYISILDTETGKDRAMVNKFGIYAIGVRGNDITLDTSDKTGKRAAFDISGMFRVECFSDKSIGERLDITMDSLPYIGDNSLQQSQLYIDGKNNLKINTGEPTVKLLHPNESYVMKSTDATIVADTKPNNDVWITLPEKPSVGMEVVIINTGTGWCYLKTDGFSKIFWDEVKTEEFVRQHTKISLLYVGGSDGLWIYVTEGLCGVRQ